MMQKTDAAPRAALRQLRANSVMEAAVGLIILFLVGVLGTLPPGAQEKSGVASLAHSRLPDVSMDSPSARPDMEP